ncbi:MAG: ATP-binding protein [Oscillospiraceae bacterium]|nr:ATP-binding protein [Oscillospiraceae bacterium]
MKLFNNSQKSTDETAALRAELAEAREQIENANRVNRSMSEFFASVSHEIRTSMNAVAGMSELLSEDAATAAQFEKIEIIKTYSNIMLGITNDLLDYSRIEQGSFDLHAEHYYFPALLENITGAARLAARVKALEFITEIPGGIPPYLFGDAEKLGRAISNLLSNAVKFTEKGSVTLSIAVNSSPENGGQSTLEFSVRDTGTGIKPEDCSRLFDVLGQAEQRRNKGMTGLGLGLTITDSIIRKMDGKLTVESIYGFGSTFRAEVPLVTGDEAQAELGADERGYVSAPGAKVLIVDDIDVNLSVGVSFFKLHDITPDIATNAKDAIKRVCEKDYDIVFMDHMMPHTDGGKASEIIRSFGGRYAKSDKPGSLRIIALTASVSPETKTLMLDKGMDDFLPKPVTRQALGRMLMKWLPADKYEIKSKTAPEAFPEDEPLFRALAGRIEELNTELGFRRSGGTAEAFKNSLRLLCRRIPKSLDKLESFLSDGRMNDFKVEAHGMKGALAINGMEVSSMLAYELELAAEAGNAETCKKNLPAFTYELNVLKNILDEIFHEEVESEENKRQGDNAALKQIIDALIINVERFDRAAALEEIKNARRYTFGGGSDRFFKDLKADLEDYDYDAAMEKLQEFNMGED